MKRRLSFALILLGLSLTAVFLLSHSYTRLNADAPDNPDLGLPAGEFVARVYYNEIADIEGLMAYDLHEYNNVDEKYVLVGLNRYGYEQLLNEGWRLAVDEQATAALTPDFDLFTYYGGYRNVDELYADMAAIVANHPDIAEIVVYGESYCKMTGGCVTLGGQAQPGYDLQALRITNQALDDPDKPVFFLMAALHSREIATPEVAMRMADWLVGGYGLNADATWMVDYHELWIVPVANPDGLWLVELGTKPPYNGNPFTQRKNANRSNGCTAWPPSNSNQYGIDLNRNHSYMWNSGGSSGVPCNLTYRGPAVASEVEVYQVENLVRAIIPDQRGPGVNDPAPPDTRGIFISLHSYSNLILWPWGYVNNPAPNYFGLKAIGDKMATYNGYISCQPPACLYAASGTSDDWAYGELGVPAYTYEIGTLAQGGFFPPYARIDDTFWPGNGPALQYAARIARTPYMTVYGPDTLNVTAVNNGNNLVTINATINDTANGNQPIVAAEYALSYPFWITDTVTGTLTAVDGNFNSPIELVTGDADVNNLLPGQHILFVRGQDSGGNWGPVTAAFFEVYNGLLETPEAITIELYPDEAVAESVGLLNSGNISLTYTISDAMPAPWLTAAPANGLILPQEALTLTLHADAAGFEPGLYETTLTILTDSPVTPLVEWPVQMMVLTPTAVIDLSPLTLDATLNPGESVTELITINSVGQLPLEWAIYDLPGYITPDPLNGALEPGDTMTLSVTFTAPAITSGAIYGGLLSIESNDPSQPFLPIWTTLTVTVPTISVSPLELEMTLMSGGSGETALSISNMGGALLEWSLFDLPGWLSITPANGTLNPGESITVSVIMTAPHTITHSVYIYPDSLLIASNDPAQPEIAIPVTMFVSPYRSFLPAIQR
jgi:hypothetical protein